MRKRYYCRPIKRYISFIFSRSFDGNPKILIVYDTTGIVAGSISINFFCSDSRCAFIDDKQYSWLPDFLVEKHIAMPTGNSLHYKAHDYPEFIFEKEI